MKIITIGRGDDCDIIIEDPMMSRRQAVMRLYPTGKIEIIDYSRNGTSVNGVKLVPEKLTRIKRGDAVTFAGTKSLDWKEIPDVSKPFRIAMWSVAGVVALVLILWAVMAVNRAVRSDVPVDAVETVTTTVPQEGAKKDTTKEFTPADLGDKIPEGFAPKAPKPKAAPEKKSPEPKKKNGNTQPTPKEPKKDTGNEPVNKPKQRRNTI